MLKDPFFTEFDTVDHVGFTIRRVVGRQFHVALLYRSKGKPYLRHFAEHGKVVVEEASDTMDLWTDISTISSVNKKLIAARLSKAARDTVPYGIGFEHNGEYLNKKTLKYSRSDGRGLTCATYVISAMETMGFKPLRTGDWKPSHEDTEWQKKSLEHNERKFPESKEHFEAERSYIGSPRFRPEHVVATAYSKDWPMEGEEARETGKRVVESYDQQRPPQLGPLMASG